MTLAKNGYSDNCITTAILHDVVEDTHYSIDDISDIGFDKEVITALTLLTHDKAVPYFEYIEKIRTNEIARAVKMADLLHNMDTSRLKVIGEKDRARLEKYHKSYEILQRS